MSLKKQPITFQVGQTKSKKGGEYVRHFYTDEYVWGNKTRTTQPHFRKAVPSF